MIYLLLIPAALILISLIPVGVRVETDAGTRRTALLVGGARLPMPKMKSKEKPRREKESLSPMQMIEKLRRLERSGVQIWEEYAGELFGRVGLTLKRFYRCLNIRVHRFDLMIGSPDPALTGMAYGAACTAASALPATIPVRLDFDFTRDSSRLTYSLSLTVIPARLLFEAVRSFITMRGWLLWRILRGANPSASARRSHV